MSVLETYGDGIRPSHRFIEEILVVIILGIIVQVFTQLMFMTAQRIFNYKPDNLRGASINFIVGGTFAVILLVIVLQYRRRWVQPCVQPPPAPEE